MKPSHLIIPFVFISLAFVNQGLGQGIYSSTKGTRFFPGHLHIVITEKDDSIRYELFNHWYSKSYMKIADYGFSLDEIPKNADTLTIQKKTNDFLLKDKTNRINRKVKSGFNRQCYSLNYIRNMSYAYEIKQIYEIGHLTFYDDIDWELPEREFSKKYWDLVSIYLNG